MGQDGHKFFLLHDSYPRPNCTNPFVTHQENGIGMSIYPLLLENSKHMLISIWLLDRAHKKRGC